MELNFISQPWQDGRNISDFLRDAIDSGGPASLRIAVAWVKRSGLTQIAPYLKEIRDCGGSVDIITGISAGGATRQGLELALEVADSVHIVHDVGGSTFHPKIYAYTGPVTRHLLVGSQNLTAGGLFLNIEAGIEFVASESEIGEHGIFTELDDWLESLVSDTDVSIELNNDRLAEMVADARYRLGDEDKRPDAKAPDDNTDADADGASDPSSPFLFKPTTRARRRPKRSGSSNTGSQTAILAEEEGSDDEGESQSLLHTWGKKLSRSEALRPNAGSNPTAVLRLGKSVFSINKDTYFLETFFGDRAWAQKEGKPDVQFCIVPFNVIVDGVQHGTHNLVIDHKPSRIADQNNISTVLHWGPIRDLIKDVDHIDHWVALRAFSGEKFELEIKTSPDPSDLPPS